MARLLVIDDDPRVIDFVSRMLAFDGHQVETATSGEQALELLENSKFDLVFTDYEMPGMKGDKLAAALKALDPNQPICMFTGHDGALQRSGSIFPGVDLVIGKPFSLDDLRQAIAKLLSK